MPPTPHLLEVWGDFACFTRPELKVERLSYPCITPSAARGIFDAIYAKPKEFRWQVTRIEVLTPPAYIALRRNEVKDRISEHTVRMWMAGTARPEPLWADGDRGALGTDMKGRTQRQTMALKNVRYRLTAEIRPWPGFASHRVAFDQQFERRASKGKCFCQPCFGCREFPAFFALASSQAAAPSSRAPAPVDVDIGLMLYDVFDLSRPGSPSDRPAISLFRATIQQGVLAVPEYASDDVLKAHGEEDGHA